MALLSVVDSLSVIRLPLLPACKYAEGKINIFNPRYLMWHMVNHFRGMKISTPKYNGLSLTDIVYFAIKIRDLGLLSLLSALPSL